MRDFLLLKKVDRQEEARIMDVEKSPSTHGLEARTVLNGVFSVDALLSSDLLDFVIRR